MYELICSLKAVMLSHGNVVFSIHQFVILAKTLMAASKVGFLAEHKASD